MQHSTSNQLLLEKVLFVQYSQHLLTLCSNRNHLDSRVCMLTAYSFAAVAAWYACLMGALHAQTCHGTIHKLVLDGQAAPCVQPVSGICIPGGVNGHSSSAQQNCNFTGSKEQQIANTFRAHLEWSPGLNLTALSTHAVPSL
jgi:hypothetical protein